MKRITKEKKNKLILPAFKTIACEANAVSIKPPPRCHGKQEVKYLTDVNGLFCSQIGFWSNLFLLLHFKQIIFSFYGHLIQHH